MRSARDSGTCLYHGLMHLASSDKIFCETSTGKNPVLERIMKLGLISSTHECPKCGDMRLCESCAIDGFEKKILIMFVEALGDVRGSMQDDTCKEFFANRDCLVYG
ncbi:hypothetical protein NPIL_491141 [Nephila pilipes]|uniref:Uncharacterized protein n=1 Tax=Nephila pilipes TaxID=299642 RepID=A0A8X6QB64_NEPPI|nr:hypothetical protein NPIL_355991 [Nephila pilipes]GFU15990.1 hypothetical protein NPIL_491141 [Nephila pilipes]